MSHLKSGLFALVAAGLSILLLSGSAAAAAPAAPAKPATGSITQTITNAPVTFANGQAGTFTGTLTVTSFQASNGQLQAVGTLVGTVTNTVTGATTAINQLVVVPITQASGSCQILFLTLGPLHLDLLGLVIDLSRVTLTITAQQGPGNLLGNLLCAIAHLLDSNGSLTAIANLLNQILAQL